MSVDIRIAKIEYSYIMKMGFTSEIEISYREPLHRFMQKIFNDIWKINLLFYPHLRKHGSVKNIKLHDKEGEISTDQALQDRIARLANFQVFVNKPNGFRSSPLFISIIKPADA